MQDVFHSAPGVLEEVLREAGDEPVPDRGVLVVDSQGRISFANRRMAELLGLELSQLGGADYSSVVSDRLGRTDASGRSPDAAAGQEPAEQVIVLEDGPTKRFIHRYSAPLFGADGTPAGRVEIYSDISHRRKLEQLVLERQLRLALQNEELRQAQDTLIRTVKLATLGELAAGVAHHLNNVLGVILGNVQLMLKKDIDDNTREKLRMCELAAKDGAETVRRIRSLSWVDQSAPAVRVDINEIVREVIMLTRPEMQAGQEPDHPRIELKTELQPVSPVIGCAPELREALSNIVLNAIQAMPSGGVLSIRTFQNDGSVCTAVEDTGIGMTEEVRSRMFSPFFTTRGPEGTGLGLSIVDAVLTKHAGSVRVESEPGKGTRVTVCLPAAPEPDPVPDRVESLSPLSPRPANPESEEVRKINTDAR